MTLVIYQRASTLANYPRQGKAERLVRFFETNGNFTRGTTTVNKATHLPRIVRIAITGGILSAALFTSAFAQEADDAESRNQETWREAITKTELPAKGCFHASYPSVAWSRAECTAAPVIPYGPRTGGIRQTVGNGGDYAAQVTSGQIAKAVGSFPNVTGVKSETGLLGANDYSLQLNSNFMNTAACNGATVPANCRSWQQFVYASGYNAAFIQYWLIDWNTTCPNGWFTYNSDCYTNSAAVSVPQEAVANPRWLKLSGYATRNGTDTLVFAMGREAFSTTGSDSVVDLATAWTAAEFNIFGDGDGSAADFNSDSSVTVRVAVSNGTNNAPTCDSDAGTTGETNNLNMSDCSSTGGFSPYIEFTESN
jgi:hypothetical protein